MSNEPPANASYQPSGSLAVKASWSSLGLALGGACLFLAFLVFDQVLVYGKDSQGVLTGVLPRAVLCLVWAGEGLAAVVGLLSFLLIRRRDIEAQALAGIAARSVCGIAVGAIGTLVLWLFVGHIVFGF